MDRYLICTLVFSESFTKTSKEHLQFCTYFSNTAFVLFGLYYMSSAVLERSLQTQQCTINLISSADINAAVEFK